MSFLVDEDYDVQARAAVLNILEISTLSRGTAENMAEEEMTSYLRPRGYDVPAIFAATADERNPLLIMYMIDLVLYHLHSNAASRAIPKNREDRYKAAIDWLHKVNRGDLDPSLPKIPDGTTDPIYRFGSDSDKINPITNLPYSSRYSSRW